MTKYLLITGTSRGIGKNLADYYISQGNFVIGCSRSKGVIEHTNFVHIPTDITEENSIKELFKKIKKDFKRLDILINNAGSANRKHILMTSYTDIKRVLDTNILSAYAMSKNAAMLMRKTKQGRIINISSVVSKLCIPDDSLYTISKSAIDAMTSTLAHELAPFRITVNGVGPSLIETDLIQDMSDKAIAHIFQRQAIRDFSTVEDIIHIINFFLHPSSNSITGQTLYLGGA